MTTRTQQKVFNAMRVIAESDAGTLLRIARGSKDDAELFSEFVRTYLELPVDVRARCAFHSATNELVRMGLSQIKRTTLEKQMMRFVSSEHVARESRRLRKEGHKVKRDFIRKAIAEAWVLDALKAGELRDKDGVVEASPKVVNRLERVVGD